MNLLAFLIVEWFDLVNPIVPTKIKKHIFILTQKRFVDNNILLHIKENRSEDEQNEITKVWNMNYKNMKYEGIEKYFLNRGGL